MPSCRRTSAALVRSPDAADPASVVVAASDFRTASPRWSRIFTESAVSCLPSCRRTSAALVRSTGADDEEELASVVTAASDFRTALPRRSCTEGPVFTASLLSGCRRRSETLDRAPPLWEPDSDEADCDEDCRAAELAPRSERDGLGASRWISRRTGAGESLFPRFVLLLSDAPWLALPRSFPRLSSAAYSRVRTSNDPDRWLKDAAG